MDREQIIDKVMSAVAGAGEDVSGIQRFQVGYLLNDAVRHTLMDIINGIYPSGGVSPYNDGLSGNESDISNLQKHLRKVFFLPITTGGIVDLSTALNSAEPMVLNTPFFSVYHADMPTKLALYVPDESELESVAEAYSDQAIAYTVVEYTAIVPEPPPYPPTLKKMLIAPDTLTGNITVVSYYLPSLAALPEVFSPYIVEAVIMKLGLGQRSTNNDKRRKNRSS